MPTLRFTDNIQRHVPCPTRQVPGETVRDALNAYFAENARARGYVLDEGGALRQHMVIFVDGRLITDRQRQSDAINPSSVIDVMQALSGG